MAAPVAQLTRGHNCHLIADEVMTGFGRCNDSSKLYASHQEGVQPDFLCLTKGLSGGYLPMAATLTTLSVFDSFLGEYEEFKTFFHGHSYFGNQLGSAVSLASMKLLAQKKSQSQRDSLRKNLRRDLKALWNLPQIGDIRQVGNVVGIELVKLFYETGECVRIRSKTFRTSGNRSAFASATPWPNSGRAYSPHRQRHCDHATLLHRPGGSAPRFGR